MNRRGFLRGAAAVALTAAWSPPLYDRVPIAWTPVGDASWLKYFLGVDYGLGADTAIMLVAVDAGGDGWVIIEEFLEQGPAPTA